MQPIDPTLSRRERERLQRRDMILRASCALFAEKGFAGTSLDEIATRAEFGKGTLYNYFPGGKEEILLAIFQELFDNLVELIESTLAVRTENSFRDRMHIFLERCFGFYNERANLFLILIREAHRVGLHDVESTRTFFMNQRKRVLEAMARPIGQAVDAGELRDVEPAFLAHLILNNIQGCQTRFCFRSDDSDACQTDSSTSMADFLSEMLFDGIASPVPSNA